MAFEIYKRGKRTIDGAPQISVKANGNLYVNTYAMENYFKGIKHVLLLFDGGRRLIGIKPLSRREENSYALNFSSKISKSTGVISARGFLKHILKGDDKSRKLRAEWNQKERCLIAKL
ncbi:hypothetical protein OAA99_02145 [Omnitrophica bacterium]|nr:hypothetical protein [Candidatus Omnitrophota bacterium]